MKWHFSLAAVSMGVLLAPSSLTAELRAGMKAPDFTENLCGASGLTGRQFSLSRDGEGRVVYLQFNSPLCSGARFLTKMVEDSVCPEFKDNPDVVFVQVAYAYVGDGMSEILSMIAATGCTQDVLAEEDGSAYASYDITGVPHSFIIDKDGIIRYAKAGIRITAGEITDEIDTLLGGGPVPEQLPILELVCDGGSCRPGDTVNIAATVSGVSRPFDAYALIRKPDGSYLSMTLSGALLPGIVPLAANVPSHLPLVSYNLLNPPIPLTAPPGMYEVIVSLADPGVFSAFCDARMTISAHRY
jgi:hypothetical protein